MDLPHYTHSVKKDDTQRALRKLSLDYVNFCKECWVYASVSASNLRYWPTLNLPKQQSNIHAEPLQLTDEHYRKLYTCFSLFVVLYVPESDFEDAPVGEELMEWLNTHFIEPSTEEGDHLSSLERPWEDDTFWPYLARYCSFHSL